MVNLPTNVGDDASTLFSLTATLISLSSEFCDELVGTACEFGDKMLSDDVGSRLLEMIGDDAFSGGDIDGDRLLNVLSLFSKPTPLLLLLISSVMVPLMLPFDGDVVMRYNNSCFEKI